MAQVRITRREWAAALGAAAAAPARAAAPAPEADDGVLLAEARGDIQQAMTVLEKFNLPIAAEPAFVFRA